MSTSRSSLLSSILRLARAPGLLLCASLLAACGSTQGTSPQGGTGSSGTVSGSTTGTSGSMVIGQTTFQSAPPYGNGSLGMVNGTPTATAGGSSGSASTATPPSAVAGAGGSTSTSTRTVQETDLYAVDGNTLYYLNSYRGLMVFDITNVDAPTLLSRWPIFGTPVQMFVQNSVAVVVVADWYGTLDASGTPFHGSIVVGLDASDPKNIQYLGDAKLGGWIQDTRIVGNVLYAVSVDYGWEYGWYAGPAVVQNNGPSVIVSSVSFANNVIQALPNPKTYPGYNGVFNVTANSILLAHSAPTGVDAGFANVVVAAGGETLDAGADASVGADSGAPIPQPYYGSAGQSILTYLDISDPGGSIVERGSVTVDGAIQANGADDGRWSLDFADGQTAHVIGCSTTYCGGGYVLATADFSNPDQPVVDSELAIPSPGWQATALFAPGRMYLSPNQGYYGSSDNTPLQIYDLSSAYQPAFAGATAMPGSVWLLIAAPTAPGAAANPGQQLFALGQDVEVDAAVDSSQVSVTYIDVTNAATPTVLGTAPFGQEWAWTPAASTFKAFTRGTTLDGTDGLVVLPFSGWDYTSQQYNNGVQLLEYTPTGITTAGAAHTSGWVERGIFANGRILSLSDLALSVVDYSSPAAPVVTGQLTLARNVVASQPSGTSIAEVSTDFWGNDVSHSDVRSLPIDDAAEIYDESTAPDAPVPGVDARVFTNGSLLYVVTAIQVQVPAPCYGIAVAPVAVSGDAGDGGTQSDCQAWQEQVSVVDISGGGATVRGTVKLPIDPAWGWYWGWEGFYPYDWYWGGEIVQVGTDALAFRRWDPRYAVSGFYIDSLESLFVVDLSNPDAPALASTAITQDPNGWWGNMKVVGNTLYTTHYEWPANPGSYPIIRYYLDSIDLSDRSHPKIGASINVPGVLVGGSSTDPSTLYLIDYQWYSNQQTNVLDVVHVSGSVATLVSSTPLDGWVGNVFVQGTTAYTSTQIYSPTGNSPPLELHQIDLSDPSHPVDQVASGPQGWGWIVDVEGDRMLVMTGWNDGNGLDVYKLTPGAAPAYDQFVRTQGWSMDSTARTTDSLFLSNGEWGVQAVPLQ
jgi:hypothetical protein